MAKRRWNLLTKKKSDTSSKPSVQETVKVDNIVTLKSAENGWKKVFDAYGGASLLGNPFALNIGGLYKNDPYLMNQRLKSLKTRPVFLTRDEIEQALLSPEYSEYPLRAATQSMLYMTYPLYRLQMLYEGILTYHSYIHPKYVSRKDMGKPRFKNEEKFIDMWLKKLNPKYQFRRITGQVLAEGKKVYYLRQNYEKESKPEVDYVYFQELPTDWCKIIKHSSDSYNVVAFDFTYFWQAGAQLGAFPPIFTKLYTEAFEPLVGEFEGTRYVDVSRVADLPYEVVAEYNSEELRWFYWIELPANKCFMFSFTEIHDLMIPPFVPLLLQSQDLSSYSLLQQQLLTVPLYSVIMGEIPFAEHNKSGSHLDDFAMSPDAVDTFEGKVNMNLPAGTQYAATPTKNNKMFNFPEIPNANSIYTKGLQDLINTSGASSLLTTTEKPSVAQVNAGKIIETRFIDRIYDQYMWAVNIILRDMYDRDDLTFEWEFKIFGDSFSDENKRNTIEKSLTLGQVQYIPEYLAYTDTTLLDAVTDIDWVEESGVYDKFKPLVNTYTLSNNSKTAKIKSDVESQGPGRPAKAENEIDNENTAASVESGTNTAENRYSLAKCIVCERDIYNGMYCSNECKMTAEEIMGENGE